MVKFIVVKFIVSAYSVIDESAEKKFYSEEFMLNSVYVKITTSTRAMSLWLSERFGIRFLLWTILVFCSRIPFLNGYGSDPDNWRILLAAKRMAVNGGYSCTRDPCHPVVTIFYSWFYPADIVILNGITALLSAIGAAALIETIRRIGGRCHILSGLSFAAVPVIFINSINTMDYLWALSLLLLAVLLISRGRALMSAILLGIACGARFEYAAMLLPMSFLILCSYKSRKKWWMLLSFWGISLCSICLVFIPVLNRYGIKLFFSKWKLGNKIEFDVVHLLNIGIFKTWGGLGVIALLIAICSLIIYLANRKRRAFSFKSLGMRYAWQLFSLLSIAGYSYAFVRLPLESGYLIPIVPFAILLGSITLQTRSTQFFAVFLLLSSLLFSVELSDASPPKGAWSVDTGFTKKNKKVQLSIDVAGPLFKIKEQREELAKRVRHSLATISSLLEDQPDNIEQLAFVVGSMQPALESQWTPSRGKDVRFFYSVSAKQMKKLKGKKVQVYVSPLGEYYSKKKHKFIALKNGSKRIEI